MTTFALDISKAKQESLKAFLVNIAILCVPMLYDIIVPNSFIKSSYYFFVGGFLTINIVRELLSEKVFQIDFDAEKRQIALTSKALMSKPEQKVIPFSQAKLEYIDEGSFFIFKGSLKLCFMKERMEVACLNEGNRGFSKEILKEIVKTAQENNLPIAFNK